MESTLSATSTQQLLQDSSRWPFDVKGMPERHSRNTKGLADWLRNQPRVNWINYIGHKDHPYHKRATRYFLRGFGAVPVYSLRDTKTLVLDLASTTHEHYSPEDRRASGVTQDMIRLSIGVEHIDDIKADFEQAFAQLSKLAVLNSCDPDIIHVQDEVNFALYGPPPRILPEYSSGTGGPL